MKNTITKNLKTQWMHSTAEWKGQEKEPVNLKIEQ